MRNLKRALSLTLASVMLLGMMVVGSSAAAGYDDVKETDNVEAIEVLQAVEVMVGDDRGFGPDRPVTRNEMAVVMGKLLNLDYNYYVSTCPFNDVANWARGWVGACYANGIVSGRGNGIYDGESSVTAIEAASMMMRALGYFKNIEDYADGFATVTVRQGSQIGIFKGVGTDANTPMTRNQVAQMALNALQSDMVTFTGTPGIDVNGVKVGYRAEYTPRTSTDPKYNRLIDNKHSSNIDYSGQYYVQLGEELYDGDLVKRVDSDIFERPSYTWTYKTEKIGTYVDQDKLLASYTTGVDGRTLYDLLNNITIRDYDLEVYVDGHVANNTSTSYSQYSYAATDEAIVASQLVRSNTKDLGITGDGVLTEVYLDRDNGVITIASIHTWLAQATSSYNSTRETSTLKVYMTNADGLTKTVNVIDVPAAENVTADSFYLVQMSDKDTNLLEVVDLDEPQILAESTVTKFTTSNEQDRTYPTKLTVDGTEYNDSDRAIYDTDVLDLYDADLLANNSYNVYLDKYGYFIGIDLAEGEKQYVFITGYDMRNSNLSVKTAEASGIFLDGTMDSITVNVKATNDNILSMVYENDDWSDPKNDTGDEGTNAAAYYQQWGTNASDGVFLLNRWYTYTVTDAGVYTLKPCVDKDGKAMMLAAKTDNNTDADTAAETDGELKLNCSKLRLDGINGTTAALLQGETMEYVATGLTSHRAYGEDDSVFITVDVDDVSGSFGTNTRITRAITDVNGVYTGVQDVDLITKTTDRVTGDYILASDHSTKAATTTNDWLSNQPADTDDQFISDGNGKSYLGENAYAVYDKNNFIIGAVILGEAEGNNATKAYILDPVKYERYENGTYYWQFEAVINGEIVTQEARSEYSDTITRMRNNQYEVVELRYNSDNIVTDVKAMDRTDTDATTAGDKIYGYPFAEILTAGHKVTDDESVYDVVLTGDDWNATATATSGLDRDNTDNGRVQFQYVTRPRTNSQEHNYGNNNTFKETQVGTLKLQGRTLYVDANQHDYGIDFVRDAKAVVKQREGTLARNDWETRAYSSVQEAIDSLGDAVPGSQNTKEFRGIITAVLNSQGVAEWVVFYSDTVAETRTDTGIGEATIRVYINIKTPGASAMRHGYVDVPRPSNANKMATVYAPDLTSEGLRAKEPQTYIVWDRINDGTTVEFEYEYMNADQAAVEAAKIAVDALDGRVFRQNAAGDKDWNNATNKFKDEVEAAINGALTGTGVTAAFNWTAPANNTDAPANGTDSSNPTAITATGVVTLSKGVENAISKTLNFTLAGLPYAQTTAGIANQRIANAKAAIGTITLPATTNANAANQNAAIALVQAAVNDKLAAATTDVTGVTATVAAGTNAAFTAPTDGVVATPAGSPGSVVVKITIACTGGTNDVQDDVTIAIPAVAYTAP